MENRNRSEAKSRLPLPINRDRELLSGLKGENRKWCTAFFKSLFVFFFCLISYVLCLSSKAAAQDVIATLKADSNHILIGDFLNVKLTVRYSNDLAVRMPSVIDTVGNMEVVKASKIDTAVNGNFNILSQTYIVSAYDSGKYHAGPQKIYYKDKSGAIDSILSDTVLISVSTVAVDTSKPIKIIKAPIDVPYTLKEFLPYILGGIGVLAIIIAAIYFIWLKRKKRKVIPQERPKPKDPPHVWARKELKKLEEDRVWQKDEIKLYYSRLTTILRLYLEYRYNWFALESTTEEIKENIDSYMVSADAKNLLLLILINADLVKFAKLVPPPDVNSKVMESASKIIDLTEQKEVTIEKMNA